MASLRLAAAALSCDSLAERVTERAKGANSTRRLAHSGWRVTDLRWIAEFPSLGLILLSHPPKFWRYPG
jgi:hypothetical protein